MKLHEHQPYYRPRGEMTYGRSVVSGSRIPKLITDISPQSVVRYTDSREDRSYGQRRVPTPMPRLRPCYRVHPRMSRQTRAAPPASAPSTSGATGGATGGASGIPGPVVQQAQQYLEDNIKRWMEPAPQPPNRDEILPLPLDNPLANPDPSSAQGHARLPSTSSSSSIPSRQQLLSRAQQALISPSSGYSEHSDPFAGLSDEERAICEKAWKQATEAERLLKQGEDAAWKQFPHSLSFGGCSQHSLLQGTSYSTPCGNSPFGIKEPSAAASFFARASQRLNLSVKRKKKTSEDRRFRTNFREVIKNHPPPVPPGLLRITGRKEVTGAGKVKVMLRMCPSHEADSSYISVDSRKKQVTLYDPTICGQETTGDRGHVGVAAPKMFAFDAVFSPDDNQAEVCSSSLCDVISSVVGGSDGCLFVYGNSKLGKTSTMVGNSNSAQEIGAIPSAIWWLFRAINEHKHRTGARFSVRVSAVELCGKAEEMRDLLADYAAGTEGSGAAPGVYLRDDQTVFGSSYLTHQSELRAPTAERAAFLLDAALAARTPETDEEAKNSHFLFTLHVYQYRVEKGERGGVSGGRSRLHLFDLGSCEKTTKSREGGSGGCLSLSALGNVILALFNGQKHVPYKDSKLTQLLREAMGSVMCRAAMIAHVSTNPSRYPETLATLQLASRVHRLRRKKLKFATDLGPIGDDKGVCRPFVRIHAVGEDGVVKSGGSDQDYTSSSEQSCDTVIFVGSGRGTPLPNSICDRKPAQPMSPLAKETRSGSPGATTGGTPKKQTKGHAAEKTSSSVATPNSAVQCSSKEQKSVDHVPLKSALNEQSRTSVSGNLSTKKKISNSPYASPKHPKLVESESPKMSPKLSKYVMIDYSDIRKSKNSGDSPAKSSPARTSKSVDIHSKSISVSATSSPQSQRKSKRSHKQEISQQMLYQQQQAEEAMQLLMKEPKPTSDETWIDGPRFTKPKFDSRTLHQLQKEKWVDGPGMYGYMDVQKETMIRKWVEDHSRIIPESDIHGRKEVWIDLPPGNEGVIHASRNIVSTMEKHSSPPVAEKHKKTHRGKLTDSLPREKSVEVPNVKPKEVSKQLNKENEEKKPKYDAPMASDLDNSINGNLSELLGHSEQESFHSSNGSVDFNDNNSEDLGNEYQTASEKNRCDVNSKIQLEDKDGCTLLIDNGMQNDVVTMTDSCIQVTEEDILSSYGWSRDAIMDNHHFSDTDSYDGKDHPLHALSADDLNLASSFNDSRAMSVDFDSLSVPEGWTPDNNYMDPDLTWRLLKGGSLPHHGSRSSQPKNLNSSENVSSKNNLLASKLERLANLRKMIEKSSHDNQERWKPPLDAEGLKSFCTSSDNRFPFVSKLHHSADSSLEELRENDINSIRSEPAELDVENFEFQFNVKPMNGLRLEAFYNKIQKVPLFPDCFSQFGKPTQVVPPLIKEQIKLIKSSTDEESLKGSINPQLNEKDVETSPNKSKNRWSTCSTKRSTPTKDIIKDQGNEGNVEKGKLQKPENEPVFEKCSPSPSHEVVQTKAEVHAVPPDRKRSLSEIIQEQRCRVYSEGPSSPQVQFHSAKYVAQRTSKSRFTSDQYLGHANHGNKTCEVSEVKHEYILVKQHQRKKGSSRFIPRGFLGSRSKQKQHVQCSYPSIAGANVAETLTVLSPGSSMTSTYVSAPQVLTEAPTHGQKSQILIRSTSTPVSPFSSSPSEAIIGGETYTYLTPAPKKGSKWAARQSSSGHGSDSSVISADMKETKELLGKMGKTPQFSGTSSGYESMPRDSEGTPLSSSSQESGSEVGAKKDARGRKGTKKKTQGSSKRSRSVPARPPINNSPTLHQQQPESMPVTRQQLRDRLVRDLHDPSLWKSEEDVCCTSLLCCRLLDFY